MSCWFEEVCAGVLSAGVEVSGESGDITVGTGGLMTSVFFFSFSSNELRSGPLVMSCIGWITTFLRVSSTNGFGGCVGSAF